jgi:hypothetical protein
VKKTNSLLFYADANDPYILYFIKLDPFYPYLALSVGRKKIGVAPIHE